MKRRIRVALTGVNNPIMAGLAALLDGDPSVAGLLLIDAIRPTLGLERGQFAKIDLTLPDAGAQMAAVLRQNKIHTVVHGAFLANPARDPVWAHELEAIGSLHVLDACVAAKVRHVVLRSSAMVYGAHHDNPAFLTEDHPLRADRTSRWICDKLEADLQFQRLGAEHPEITMTIARLATVIAPSVTHYLARFLSRPMVPVIAGYDPLLQFLHLDDAAQALWAMVRRPITGVFNVAPGEVLPLSSVLRIGGRIPLPIPYIVSRTTARLLWRLQLMDVPPRFLNYFRYPWNIDGARAVDIFGLEARHTSVDVVAEFYRGSDTPRAAGPCNESGGSKP